MKAEAFWKELDAAQSKEMKDWEKRAKATLARYRGETVDKHVASFNILWANTEVQQPNLFSQVPNPDIRRRFANEDPIAKEGSEVLEKALKFFLDEGDFYTFGVQSTRDFLLPGRTVCKLRYVPTLARKVKQLPVDKATMSVAGEPVNEEELTVDDQGQLVAEREIEEVVDESIAIDRWPWKNFFHQKAKRWADVTWIDYVSYIRFDRLEEMYGKPWVDKIKAAAETETDMEPTHGEIHEVWFKETREVRVTAKGLTKEWIEKKADPLKLEGFWPTPQPLMAMDTNDSLVPIPLFTLYQDLANELDLITHRIQLLMRAIKVAGLYAGNEKAAIQTLAEADENMMIPVADWAAFQNSGGVDRAIAWWPVDQIGKVLTYLFAERDTIKQQIFELTGLSDIQRGATDPRETRGAQQLKAQFGTRRQFSPKMEIERYFRDVLVMAAELMAEHFDKATLQRITGMEQIQDETMQLLKSQLLRVYRINIETDTLLAPDEEREKAHMAEALQATANYMGTVAPLVQQGAIPQDIAIKTLNTYLRKFKFGRELEEAFEEAAQRPPQPSPQEQAQQAAAEAEQQKMQQEAQIKQQEAEQKAQERREQFMMKMQEMSARLDNQRQEFQQNMIQDRQEHLQEMAQDRQQFMQELEQMRIKFAEELRQLRDRSRFANAS